MIIYSNSPKGEKNKFVIVKQINAPIFVKYTFDTSVIDKKVALLIIKFKIMLKDQVLAYLQT